MQFTPKRSSHAESTPLPNQKRQRIFPTGSPSSGDPFASGSAVSMHTPAQKGCPFRSRKPTRAPPQLPKDNAVVMSSMQPQEPEENDEYRSLSPCTPRCQSPSSRSSPRTPPAPNRHRLPPLDVAIRLNDRELVRMLLDEGEADPNNPLMSSRRIPEEPRVELPLLLAARKSTPAVVSALLSSGAVPNGVNGQGQNALHVLCHSAVEVENPPPVLPTFSLNGELPQEGPTPESWSALRSKERSLICRVLLQAGTDALAKDASNITPLSLACSLELTELRNQMQTHLDSLRRQQFQILADSPDAPPNLSQSMPCIPAFPGQHPSQEALRFAAEWVPFQQQMVGRGAASPFRMTAEFIGMEP